VKCKSLAALETANDDLSARNTAYQKDLVQNNFPKKVKLKFNWCLVDLIPNLSINLSLESPKTYKSTTCKIAQG